jgi:LPS-assembly protein
MAHPLLFLVMAACWILPCLGAEAAGGGFSKNRFLLEDSAAWEINAERLVRDGTTYVAQGSVRIHRGAHSLSCEKAIYDPERGIAEVFGNVRLESSGDLLAGERGFFNLNDRTARIEKGILFIRENHIWISGDSMERLDDDTYRASNVRVTTCDGENPDWSITGSDLTVVIEGYGQVKNAAFRVKDQPLFYVPYMIFPAKIKRQSGFLPPRLGYATNIGVDLEVPFFWAISENTDATFYQRYMGERGYMQGLEYRFVSGERSKGMILFDVLSDRRTSKDMTILDERRISPYQRTNNTRYWMRGRSDVDLPLRAKARLDLDYISDQDYLLEFEDSLFGFDWRPDLEKESGRPVEDKRSPTRHSGLRLSREWDDALLHGSASYDQLPENPTKDSTAQPIMGLTFMTLPGRLRPSPAFLTMDAAYDHVWREEGQDGHRVEASPFISMPFWTGPYIEWEPYLRYTYNGRWMGDGYGRKEEQYRTAYETGARVSTDFERIYDVSWGDATGMMHKISPVLSYRHRELVEKWNPKEKKPWFEPVEFEGDVNRVSLSIENFFNGRHEDAKGKRNYMQWATFDLTQGYDILETTKPLKQGQKRKPFAPLTMELTFTPASSINFSSSASWDHYDESIARTSASLDLYIPRAGGRRDYITFDYLYRTGIEESLQLETEINLVYGFSVGGYLQENLYESRNVSSAAWLRWLGQCWGVRMGMENDDIRTRVMVVFELVGLGEGKVKGSVTRD